MSEQSQIAPLTGPMNQDTHPKHVRTDDGQVIERVNLRVNSTSGRMLANNKIAGTLTVPMALPAGDNKVIGWCDHKTDNAILYFIYNSNSDHCVMQYLVNEKTLQKLWYAQPALGLEDTILRAQVVEGNIYWVNGSQKPKGFNIEYAYNFTNNITSDEKYTAADELSEVFNAVRFPPRFAPVCNYDADSTYNFNNLRKRLFQFKYAYQYFDGQISAWSPISKVPLPEGEIGANGEFSTDISINNVIKIKLNTGSRLVKKILVAARDTYPRNTGSFFEFEKIEKYNKDTGEQVVLDDSDYIVSFYNNKITASIDTEINNRYCDHMPLAGNDVTLLDGKYLAISMPSTGYEGVVPDYSLYPVENNVEFDISSIPMAVSNPRMYLIGLLPRRYDRIDIPSTFYPEASYSISFRVNGKNYYFIQNTGLIDPDYPNSVRNAFIDEISDTMAAEPDIAFALVVGRDNTGIIMKFYEDIDPILDIAVNPYDLEDLSGTVTTSIGDFVPSYKSLKRGQYHPFGLIYNDREGRYNIVFANNELYVPVADWDPSSDDPKRVNCQWVIRHRPPVDAVTYRWCYIRNKSYTYFQYFAHVKCTIGTPGNHIPSGKRLLELNQSLARIREAYPNFIVSDYEWQNGDRIRIVGQTESYEILAPFTWVDEDDPESGVNGFLVSTDFPSDDDQVLLEVYRQNPAPQDVIYMEIGDEYEILDAGTENRRHQGQFGDQSANLTTPATGILDFGDVYLRYRLTVSQTGVTGAMGIEDEYYNDYYRSDAIDIGRVGVKTDTENKTLNRIVRSENYIENTEYNQLNVWLPESDYFIASDRYGPITGMVNAGDVLKVYQEHKETSIYIGKNMVKQADGTDIALATDKVFGTTNRYTEDRGTQYRRSIVANDRYVYYFDSTTGEFVRSSPNGQAPISVEYAMSGYFENKAKTLREYVGHKDIIVGVYDQYKEVYVSFIMGNSIETIVFSEDDRMKGWQYMTTLYNDTHIIQNIASYGDEMFSFLNGQLYIHGRGGTLNNFYGKQHSCGVTFVVNKFPSQIKRFKNILISTDRNVWGIEFNIPAGLNYGAQKTLLRPTVIRARENRLVSDINRNIIGKNGDEDVNLLYKGERMTGEYMEVEISNDDSTDVELREIEVKFLIST